MASSIDSSISVRNITKIYNQNTKHPFVALDNISFDLEGGKSLALLGHNGAGKTTFIKIINTILNPTFGDATIGGLNLLQDPTAIKYISSYTTQDISLDPNITVLQTLQLQSLYYGIFNNRKKIEYLLEIVDLHNESNSRVRYLSGGMKRRLMIAKSLVQDPRIIILDEPTVGIDLTLKEKIISCIKTLKEEGKTIILSTHAFDEVERLCDVITIFKSGKKVYFNNMDNLKSRATNKLHYIVDISNAKSNFKTLISQYCTQYSNSMIIGICKKQNNSLKNKEIELYSQNSSEGIALINILVSNIEGKIKRITNERTSMQDNIEDLMHKYSKYKDK